jgi:hypothetical protein
LSFALLVKIQNNPALVKEGMNEIHFNKHANSVEKMPGYREKIIRKNKTGKNLAALTK